LKSVVDDIVRTSEPLAHLAARAGFADQSHLARVLKKRAGVPASVLRRFASGNQP
jgi:AraC-like DNA-binding protein